MVYKSSYNWGAPSCTSLKKNRWVQWVHVVLDPELEWIWSQDTTGRSFHMHSFSRSRKWPGGEIALDYGAEKRRIILRSLRSEKFWGKEPVPCNLNLPAHSAQSSVLVGSWLGHGAGVGASWLYKKNQAADPHVGLAGQAPWMLVRVRCHWWGLGFENMSLNVSECHMLKPVLSVCFEKWYSLVGWSLDCTFHHPWMSGRV